MKRYLKNYKKVISIVLAAVLLCGCTGMLTYAAGAKSLDNNLAKADNMIQAATNTEAIGLNLQTTENSKDETVYVIANVDGSANKIIVSDWIKNALEDSSIIDSTMLDYIKNTKDDTSYSLNDDNARVWDAEGNDIYYQGDIEKELPVDVMISYKLDGKTVSADELAGKSGKVTIRFDYTNKQYEEVKIDGVNTKIYVPFALLSGMVLDNDEFTNVSVTNGKLINDGDRTLVMGIALPGMQSNLDLDTDTFEVPSYVEINADVSSFELATTLTLATNEVFNDINLDNADSIDNLDNLSGSVDDLSEAMSMLMEGSSQLYDGLSTLLDKSGELIGGIDQLLDGATQLCQGTKDLNNGAEQLQAGIGTLAAGLNQLTSNSDSLKAGSKQVFETLLATADAQMEAASLTITKLTISNYESVLAGVLSSLDEDAVHDLAYNTALDSVTSSVRKQEALIESKVEAVVEGKVLEGVLGAVGQNMTADQYESAVEAGKISSELQAQITSAVDAQMKSDAVQKQIDTNAEAQIQSLISQNMKSSKVTSQIDAAVEKVKVGAESIATLKTQLNSYNQFYQGLVSYTNGVDQADVGAKALVSGNKALTAGTSQLSDGADDLCAGLKTLKEGGNSLIDGVSQLKDGSMQLSDGLVEFNEEGVQKLIDAFDGDLGGLVARLKASVEVSKNYKSFSGKSDNMDGNVKFIYRTDSITE